MKSGYNFFWILLLCSTVSIAQESATAKMTFGKGIQFTSADSTFTLAISGRVQSMFEARRDMTTEELGGDFLLRRCRLNLQGTGFNPKFTYRIQLGFSANDISAANSSSQNNLVLRDAMLFYAPAKWIRFGFGQTKLPGNRQRLVSSANLQLVERSITNNNFTLDRDKGLWIYNNFNLGSTVLKATLTVSSGEGRIASNSNGKLCYSARAEFLPFGEFTNGGDIIEADNEKEARPKLSLAGVVSYNDGTSRTMGQLGEFLYNKETSFILYTGGDFLFKYKGFSLEGEFYNRSANTGIITNAKDTTQTNYVTAGYSYMVQSGCFITKSNEIAARYAHIEPAGRISSLARKQDEFVLGFSHYFSKHSLKLQSDVSYFINGDDQTLVYRLSGVVTF